MKNILALVLVVVNLSAFACDNCNVYLGINPNDFYHNFGIRYRMRLHQGTFTSAGTLMLKHGGAEPIYTNSTIRETYQRVELTGKYYWNPKLNTQIIVPYVFNSEEVDQSLKYFVQGIGDVTILQNYLLFNTKDHSDSTLFKQRLSVGMGLKLPTGSIDIIRPLGTPNIDLQPGTGSWDGLFSLTYSAMYKKAGVVLNGNYKLNTFNRNDFKYGNTLNFSGRLFYLARLGDNLQLMPSAGVYSEYFSQDYDNRVLVDDSGGDTWMFDAGINWYFHKVNLQFNYQSALINKLENEQQIPTKWRLNVGLYYNF